MTGVYRAAMAAVVALALPVVTSGAGAQPVRVTPAPPQPSPAAPDAAGQIPVVPDRFVRARQNLTALLEGRVAVSALSPEELQDVLELDRMLRAGREEVATPRQQCVDDEVRRAGGRPSRLAWEVIRLKCR